MKWLISCLVTKYLGDKLAKVGRLSANAKNAFNFYVGRIFANLR